MKIYAVIRVRAANEKNHSQELTLAMLRLHKPNHAVLVTDRADGMLKKVQEFVTWGEIQPNTLEQLIEKRGRLTKNKRLTESMLKEKKIPSLKEIASQALTDLKVFEKYGIKPVFRLNPPSKGYERAGIKKMFKVGGALGYRGEKINQLIERMM
ncbi:MAG: 50S ribosomal protein L30 [Candidatus Diapherotrites archaeon]|nr:50S ribosomal protein L30 [Candidatus Diapherotrites archaeon]